MQRTILVVDDSPIDRCLVGGLLKKNSQFQIEYAEDGKQALDRCSWALPDLVITDLIMPEIGGLKLLRILRWWQPAVPVIVMTAYGNERIAVEALAAGAASYVPKSQQAERLMETVVRVLEHADADRQRGQFDQGVEDYRLRLSLENDPAQIRPVVEQLQRMMTSVRFTDAGERIRVGEAFEQALLNAIYHGNLEIGERELASARSQLDDLLLPALVRQRRQRPEFRDRRVHVELEVSANEVRVVVRDDGPGFNVDSILASDLGEAFERGRHRGLRLIRSLMDEVRFNAQGNEITLCKRKRQPAAV